MLCFQINREPSGGWRLGGGWLINILQFQVNLLRGQKGCLVHYKNNEHSQHSTAAVSKTTVILKVSGSDYVEGLRIIRR